MSDGRGRFRHRPSGFTVPTLRLEKLYPLKLKQEGVTVPLSVRTMYADGAISAVTRVTGSVN